MLGGASENVLATTVFRIADKTLHQVEFLPRRTRILLGPARRRIADRTARLLRCPTRTLGMPSPVVRRSADSRKSDHTHHDGHPHNHRDHDGRPACREKDP